MKVRWLSAVALSAGLCGSAFAQITGTVKLEGKAPDMPEIKQVQSVPQCAAIHKDPVYEDTVLVGDNGELANVIVYLKPAEGQELKGPQIEKPAVLDQKGCMYTPHVLAVMTGQPVLVKNSDPFLHNVHSLAIDNPTFNFAQPNISEKKLEPFTAVENFQIKCDVHPWMKSVIRVFDNPYFATTGEDGKFSIDTKGLKDGSYTVVAWHEKYHESAPQKVEVKDGKAKPVAFKFDASAKAEATPMKVIHLASADSNACCSKAVKAN